LCLLEVARRGAKFGMPAPLLVQFEKEIDRELAKDQQVGLFLPYCVCEYANEMIFRSFVGGSFA